MASDVNHLKAVSFTVEANSKEKPHVREIRTVVDGLFVIAVLEKGKPLQGAPAGTITNRPSHTRGISRSSAANTGELI